ncbi:Crp/Fnr family transcriptional regulator [Sphingobacterium corticibacter]|uniref:Cyclic nucleotide-binding domain-containing protein n=1 Tax=Sphingobacterium corticibacter TaxID=2171749 RepID=A0A2T8HNT0_9SPHI|nr:Crp/Fnr family transcriptional regulator [Sphingobacterium corticibacter]PVH27109.1 hypothetical protein DC487_05800 [Sphingobacterium corticibacter]
MMIQEKFKNSLSAIIDMEDTEWEKLYSAFELQQVPAGTVLTRIGGTERKLYFIVQGIVRLYCIGSKQQDVTVFLFKEHHFASSYQSFLTQELSDQALETLEPCTLMVINRRDFDKLHETVPKVNQLTRIIAEQRFINAQRIFSSHITQTPEQRYLNFERQQGDLLLRVPHHIIASFLGITSVSLSRIRNRVCRK